MARRKSPEVNAGSMADIAFLLLIFFLVTTTIETDSGINRKLPPMEEQIDPPIIRQKNIFTVVVNKNNQLLVVTLTFSLRGLAKDKAKMKSALTSFGLFLVVIVIAFVLSSGVETPMRDGKVLSAIGSRLVGTGIRVFYILVIVAVGLMIFSGGKKFIKK